MGCKMVGEDDLKSCSSRLCLFFEGVGVGGGGIVKGGEGSLSILL